MKFTTQAIHYLLEDPTSQDIRKAITFLQAELEERENPPKAVDQRNNPSIFQWINDYCKFRGLSPSHPANYKEAAEAYAEAFQNNP